MQNAAHPGGGTGSCPDVAFQTYPILFTKSRIWLLTVHESAHIIESANNQQWMHSGELYVCIIVHFGKLFKHYLAHRCTFVIMPKSGGVLVCTLYENLLSLCEERGITGGKMCTDVGLSKGLMTGLKKGRRSSISVESAQKIADYFGVTVDRVLGGEQKETPTVSDERSDDDLALLEKFREADESTRAAIRLLLKL